ncbi:MAG: COG4223 family protein, partial [Methyloligellaceae bacterium]
QAGKQDNGTAKPSASPPPQRTKPSDVKSFITHLAAGLAGGLIGVIGVSIALDRLPIDQTEDGPPGKPQAIQQFEQRLDALDARLSEQAKSIAASSQVSSQADGPNIGEALTKLDARITAQENKPAAAADDLQTLKSRLEKLEDTLKTLQASGGDDGASGVAHGLEDRLAALENNIAGLASRPPARGVQDSPDSAGAALALAVASLRRAIDRGEAFSGQMTSLKQIAPAGLDLSTLSKHAGAGVRTDAALLSELAPALKAAREAAARSDDDTFLDRLVSNAQSVVRVRRIGPADGESADAVLSRMEAHMKAADLAGVLSQAESLSGPALESLQPWLGKAKAKRSVQGNLEQLEQGLLAGLHPGRDESEKR